MVRTWQMAQPTASKVAEPATAAGVAARTRSRGGALVARMKLAKTSTSAPSSSGSATPSSTTTPFAVLSVGRNGVVMPISFR